MIDKDRFLACRDVDTFGMPAAAPLLPHAGILRAADGNAEGILRIADVATDAFADVVESSLANFCRQERIRNGGARGAHKVEHTTLHL